MMQLSPMPLKLSIKALEFINNVVNVAVTTAFTTSVKAELLSCSLAADWASTQLEHSQFFITSRSVDIFIFYLNWDRLATWQLFASNYGSVSAVFVVRDYIKLQSLFWYLSTSQRTWGMISTIFGFGGCQVLTLYIWNTFLKGKFTQKLTFCNLFIHVDLTFSRNAIATLDNIMVVMDKPKSIINVVLMV